ncbi:hypothetical protein PBY51_003868 [Eleginops maclovinus]|uniref:UPAR/Ly6 domain-containing protein n=1 Tax=Eleginops maclovinus TaxID=56733 RepID=A0AAN7Y299_ELEMC|nr:hypothetical protein PBY51_003868 [Eleginops maclovinus]
MMKLYGVLILFITLSAVCGLRCYTCTATDPKSCIDTKSCPVIFNRCFSLRIDGYSMMQFYGALILLMTLSAAYGLKCYSCFGSHACLTTTCPPGLDRCSSAELLGNKMKSCLASAACVSPIECCAEDLCNSALPIGCSPVLLLLSSAIITVFL